MLRLMTRDGLSSAFTTTLLVLLLEAVKLLRLNLVFGLVMSGLRPWKVMFEGEMVLLFFWIVAGVNNKVEEAEAAIVVAACTKSSWLPQRV